jgi:hypothetical protein
MGSLLLTMTGEVDDADRSTELMRPWHFVLTFGVISLLVSTSCPPRRASPVRRMGGLGGPVTRQLITGPLPGVVLGTV